MSSIAVIPARGGSKRIPRKNLRMMSGRPLMSWAVDTALAAACFSRVVVSTDDEEIAQVALDCGAEVPFVRPTALADDHASTISVMNHAVSELRRQGDDSDAICCIYPAAIFVTAADFERARFLLMESDLDYCVAVTRYSHPIQRAFNVDDAGRVSFIDPETARSRTQDLPPRWHDAGQFYWGRPSAWLTQIPILENAVAYELPPARAIDIDTEQDWQLAEGLHSIRELR